MFVGRTADESPRAHVDQLSTGLWRGRRRSARTIMSIETAKKTGVGRYARFIDMGAANRPVGY